MIRFIDLTNQISENEKCFCFFDTIDDSFIVFNNKQVFCTNKSFIDAFVIEDMWNDYDIHNLRPIERFLNLIPKNFFTDEL